MILRNVIITSLITFGLVGSVYAQQLVEITYDKATGKTTATTKTELLSGSPLEGLHLKFVAVHEGTDLKSTDQIGLIIFSVSEKPHLLEKDRLLTIYIGDEEVNLGEMTLSFDQYDQIRYMRGLYARIDIFLLTKLAKTQKVSGKIGSKEFKLNVEHRRSINAFLAYLEPIRTR